MSKVQHALQDQARAYLSHKGLSQIDCFPSQGSSKVKKPLIDCCAMYRYRYSIIERFRLYRETKVMSTVRHALQDQASAYMLHIGIGLSQGDCLSGQG
jgi:hypothetical protein